MESTDLQVEIPSLIEDESNELLEEITVSTEEQAFESCNICTEASKQKNPQHRCSICYKVVCSLACSIADPNSDNEMHRVHKHGDSRCVPVNNWPIGDQEIPFECPLCDQSFKDNVELESHIADKHGQFETTFPTMSLASDGSLSDVYERCKQCGKMFENELDLKNHIERVHVYGETFAIYPCEECGFRGTDVQEFKTHISETHSNDSTLYNTANSLRHLGIESLPIISQRRKQNLKDLNIDENGDILLDEDSDDEDFNSQDKLLLQEEEDYASHNEFEITVPMKTRATKTLVEEPTKKRKVDQDIVVYKNRNHVHCNVMCVIPPLQERIT